MGGRHGEGSQVSCTGRDLARVYVGSNILVRSIAREGSVHKVHTVAIIVDPLHHGGTRTYLLPDGLILLFHEAFLLSDQHHLSCRRRRRHS